jgi:DNA-binding SARP family transcriptional activator
MQIALFGKFRVRCAGKDLTGFEQARVQELFCYLLLHRGRHHSREMLASLLWGDQPTPQARRYLSKALWQLQVSLSQAVLDHQELLNVDLDWLYLNPQAGVWLDVAIFEQAYQQVRDLPGGSLTCEDFASLQKVVDLYTGDLLEGWFHDWCLCERERLQHIYLVMLEKLMRYCEAHRHYEAGQQYGYWILRVDRAREQTHRQLMRLFYLAGDRTAALRQYRQCCAVLHQELDVQVSSRTQQLYQQICADHLDVQAAAPLAEGKDVLAGVAQ